MHSKIYHGTVSHTRLEPLGHAFSYPVHFFGLDLAELPQLDRTVAGFGYNRFRPVSLYDRDYLESGESAIMEKLRSRLREADVTARVHRIELVTSLRYFGYVFNPVNFYLCYDEEQHLVCVLAEVNNTFGDRHVYLVRELGPEANGYRATRLQKKEFHVSPFNDMSGAYAFEYEIRRDRLVIKVNLVRNGNTVLAAQLEGAPQPLSSANLARTMVMYPLSAVLTMPRILRQAATLYFRKKLRVYRRPEPTSENTIRRKPPSWWERIAMKAVLQLLGRMRTGTVRLQLPDGSTRELGRPGSGAAQNLQVRRYSFFTRVLLAGDIGFGEAYMHGDFETDDLTGLISVLGRNRDVFPSKNLWPARLGALRDALKHAGRANSKAMSRRNIYEHYDLSNEFFRSFLDPTMTYSCAMYRSPNETLEQAQRNKLHALLRKAEITADCHVLEIGSGWGSLAIEAARSTGCRVTSITISQQQYDLARERVRRAGLATQVEIRLCDYRDIEGQFDRVLSVEMLEAVGHGHLGLFFRQVDRLLRQDGIAVIQAITYPDQHYETYRKQSDWIRKHIFPGGHLPSFSALGRAMTRHSDLVVQDVENIGPHYAATLAAWRERFLHNTPTAHGPAADRLFRRKWLYYLAYCEAGFALRYLNNLQLVLARAGTVRQENSITLPIQPADSPEPGVSELQSAGSAERVLP